MTATTTWVYDLGVISVVGLITSVVRTSARKYFERSISEWSKLDEAVKSRLAVEVGVIPSRIVLFYLTLPVVLNGFSPLETWTASDTTNSLLSWYVGHKSLFGQRLTVVPQCYFDWSLYH